MLNTRHKVLILYSGGLDSLAVLLLLKKTHDCFLLFIDYGHRACCQEKEIAEIVSEKYGLQMKIVALPWYSELAESNPLVNAEKQLPEKVEIDDYQQSLSSAQTVWLPNRNGLFLNIAACYAEQAGLEYIAAGFNHEESQTFPDNSADFSRAADIFFSFSTGTGIKLLTPLIEFDKRDIARIVADNSACEFFYSCYKGNTLMCGSCESCLRTKRAFTQINENTRISGRFHGTTDC